MKTISRILSVFCLTVILTLGIPTPAHAQGIVYGDTIPKGTVVNQDVVLIGQDVLIDGTVNGNAFILGNQVVINGKVDGSLVLVGQNAKISGEVTGAVYSVALTLELGPEARLGRDLYAATISLTSGKGATIERDLFAVGLDAGLNGKVQRDLHTAIGPIQLYNGLMDLLGFPNLTLRLHFETPNPGGSGSLPTVRGHARILHLEKNPQGFDWGKWGLDLLRKWVVLLAFSLITYWVSRKGLQQTAVPILKKPWKTLGIGLIVLVISFALFGVALLLAVLVFALGLGLNYLGVWQITIALWAAAYASLALGVVALWFFIAYAVKIILIHAAANRAAGAIFKQKSPWIDLAALLCGTIVFVLLVSIPYVGWIFSVLVSAAGAGAVWIAFRESKKVVEVPVKPIKTNKPKPKK